MVFSSVDYGPAAAPFLTRLQGAAELTGLDSAALFPRAAFPREALAGLWLLFDQLDRSHALSQELQTPEASFWHGIMHRREPDAANAAYWFRRVGKHRVFPLIRQAAAKAGYSQGKSEWDPFSWIEYWDRTRRRVESDEHKLALVVQRIEWEILFDHCARPIGD